MEQNFVRNTCEELTKLMLLMRLVVAPSARNQAEWLQALPQARRDKSQRVTIKSSWRLVSLKAGTPVSRAKWKQLMDHLESNMGVSINGPHFGVLTTEGSHYFGSILGAPDLWKLPCGVDDSSSLLLASAAHLRCALEHKADPRNPEYCVVIDGDKYENGAKIQLLSLQ